MFLFDCRVFHCFVLTDFLIAAVARLLALMSVAMASSALGNARSYRSGVVRRIWIGGVRGHRRGISYCGPSPNDHRYTDLG